MIKILFLCFLQFSPLFAQEDAGPKKSNSTIDMLAILELFTSIEGEEHVPKTFREKIISLTKKQTWQAVSQNLNVLNVATNSYRVYSMNMADPSNGNNTEKMEHVKNLAIILPLSHGIEMVAGEVSMLIAANMGTSIGGIAALGVIGAIIKIPFFVDPLCIIFITSYKYFPVFRKGITFLRTATVTSFTYITKWTGLRQFWETFFYHKSVIDQLHGLQNKGWSLRPGLDLILDRPELSLYIDFKNGHYFVKQVVGNLDNSKPLRDLPFNIRQAIGRTIVKGNHEFYLETRAQSVFTFKDYSLPWNASISRRQLCGNLWNF